MFIVPKLCFLQSQDEVSPRSPFTPTDNVKSLRTAHFPIQQWINPHGDEGMWAAAAQEEEQVVL